MKRTQTIDRSSRSTTISDQETKSRRRRTQSDGDDEEEAEEQRRRQEVEYYSIAAIMRVLEYNHAFDAYLYYQPLLPPPLPHPMVCSWIQRARTAVLHSCTWLLSDQGRARCDGQSQGLLSHLMSPRVIISDFAISAPKSSSSIHIRSVTSTRIARDCTTSMDSVCSRYRSTSYDKML